MMEGADRFQNKFEAMQVSKIKKLEGRVELIKLILDITGPKPQFPGAVAPLYTGTRR